MMLNAIARCDRPSFGIADPIAAGCGFRPRSSSDLGNRKGDQERARADRDQAALLDHGAPRQLPK
jgi:hypothetical protein